MGWPGESREAGCCMFGKNVLGTKTASPKCTGRQQSWKGKGQREGLNPTIMWFRVPKQPEFVYTVSSPFWTYLLGCLCFQLQPRWPPSHTHTGLGSTRPAIVLAIVFLQLCPLPGMLLPQTLVWPSPSPTSGLSSNITILSETFPGQPMHGEALLYLHALLHFSPWHLS